MGGASSTGNSAQEEQAILKCSYSFSASPPDDAVGQPIKQRDHNAGDTVGRHGKCIGTQDNGGVSRSIMCYDICQLQPLNEDTQSLLFSCHPRGAAHDPSGSRDNVQQISSFKLDGAKHKIFLSHSGAQKDFVEQLCVDLERRGYLFPFFDQRHHSLPKGGDFAALIKEAAQLCHVAVIVLSEEFLGSKWPMIELAEFHAAKRAGNHALNMLPLFYKLSVEDLNDRSIKDRWMPLWIRHASKDSRIDVRKWIEAVRALRGMNGLTFRKGAMSKVAYRKDVVQCISKLSPPDILNDSSRDMVGYHRICQRVSSQFVEDSRVGASVLGLYGMSGLGKSTLSRGLCDYLDGEFSGRVCHVELLDKASRTSRQKLMLENLCGFKDELDRIIDVQQGLRLMRQYMKREPVFLVVDNVSNDQSSWDEAHDYLTVGFHPKSKIMITSRSRDILQDLLPGVNFCMPMPGLSVKEAGVVFLRRAAPMKSISSLTDEERVILGLCIQQCLFGSKRVISWSDLDEDKLHFLSEEHKLRLKCGWSYHSLALSAAGDFFRRYVSNNNMLPWKDHLEKDKDELKDVWKAGSITNRIRITSRGEVILPDLLPDVKFCMPMPRLSSKDAGALFWRRTASLPAAMENTPMKSISTLRDEEQAILLRCIQQWLFQSYKDNPWIGSDEDEFRFLLEEHKLRLKWGWIYHPLALSAVGDFFRKYISNNNMLHWKDHLEKKKDNIKDIWKSSNITSIIDLQFRALHPSEQLVFLDIALYLNYWLGITDLLFHYDWNFDGLVEWLARVHEETPAIIKRKLQDLKRSGMVDWDNETKDSDYFDITVPALYKEFAEWYVIEHDVKRWKNAWGVFRTSGTSLRSDPPAASKCWSDLVRLRIFDLTITNARLVASKKMQELHNLVLLQLHGCTNLKVLNLEGLDSLRHLELIKLTNLETITLSGDENAGIYESLQHVLLEDLDSLMHVPDLRACAGMHSFRLLSCKEVTNFEALECPYLEELVLYWLVPHQFATLPNVKALHALRKFYISIDSDMSLWELYEDGVEDGFQRPPNLEEQDGGGVEADFEYLEEFLVSLRQLIENPKKMWVDGSGWEECPIEVHRNGSGWLWMFGWFRLKVYLWETPL